MAGEMPQDFCDGPLASVWRLCAGNSLPSADVPPSVPTWEDVARTHGRFLYTVAYRLTGNDADAQDLVQEVLLRVRRGLATYRPGSLEGWLSRIATNAFLDEVRRRKRRPVEALPEEPGAVLAAPDDVEATLAATALGDEIQAALAGLPEEFRVAVVLCDVVGLRYEEIARYLDVPVGTVRSRIHRGRSSLRQVLR